MKRSLVIAAGVVAGLALVGVAALPRLVDGYAERQVDKALNDIRVRSTAVANRGAVTVDLGSRTVFVNGITVETPGDAGARVSIDRLAIVRPTSLDERVAAELVRFENLVIAIGNETVRVPAIEVRNYSGPAQGLVSAPGGGDATRTQADIAAGVSAAGASAPLIEMTNARIGVKRQLTGLAFERTDSGVVSRATADKLTVEVPARRSVAKGVQVSTGRQTFHGVSLPAVLRFLAGDGAGQREPAIDRAVIEQVAVTAPTKVGGDVSAGAGRLELEKISIRALLHPAATLELAQDKAQRGEPLTPAETRQQVLFLTDSLRAAAFGRVAAFDAVLEASPPGQDRVSGSAALIELAGYADGALQRVSLRGARAQEDDRSAGFDEANLERIDAGGLLAYAERIGRDEILLTTTPLPEDMLKLFPRLGRANLTNGAWAEGDWALKVGEIRSGARGDAEELPNRAGVRVTNLTMPAPQDRWYSPYLKDAGVERLNLTFRMVASLDPGSQVLTLEGLDYSDPEIADVHVEGTLANVDPALAIERGGAFVDKLSRVALRPIALRVVDHGGVAAAFAAGAKARGSTLEAFRESFTQDAEARLTAVLGPSAQASATALGLFLRGGGKLEATILPRADATLLNLIQLARLGPEGVAQALDVTITSRTN
ncbi:hypothetical protein GCM10008171_10770 [Methylopila jiangsuensis]|uniref:Uncharacterized protein n=1 Tax=Methylopila jiangsuensis TaxID=586230 RepID=A0A9W6N317_9HYPH|nr:hypothetical protein [Methylopila jiangsuensis]MDR6286065.1 hypothetical protein [Methylopila jiangsuensis]GLK75823.1 hypothetical protein GCM10008171_10770 [Methylopila jiangsuensis]